MISTISLIACGVNPTQAKLFAEPISRACELFRISLLSHRAAFISQAMHESGDFAKLEESTYYSRPENIHKTFKRLRVVPLGTLAAGYIKKPQALANLAYANVNGNGDEVSGDGWRYRGRGLFQLTGRANYMAAGAALGRPYKEEPELVVQPLDAAMTAGWFWATARLSSAFDEGGFDATSRRINGAQSNANVNGLEERRELFADCMKALA